MRVTDAIKHVAELTGNSGNEATLCRWLSELDGQLMFDFYKGDAFIGYTWDTDQNAELLVPFPWDGFYVHYLEAMVYYSNGEYDRYQNAITQYNKGIDDYRKWLTRKAVPINPALLQGRPVGGTPTTVNFAGTNDTPWYFLSAYALAVKHGYAGTTEEWLESLKGLSAYDVAIEEGFKGTKKEWLDSLVGPAGGVDSFNGRQGAVKPQAGDYTTADLGLSASAQQIDDAVELSVWQSNPNLLDNWYFVNPVNQRGKTEYTGVGYTIDRWKLTNAACILRVDTHGMLLTNSGSYSYVQQRLENSEQYYGKTVTVSVLIDNQLYSATGTVPEASGTSNLQIAKISLANATTGAWLGTDGLVFVQLSAAGGAVRTHQAAKLELGDQQTLAHQDASGNWVLNEIPDYGEQLLRCCMSTADSTDTYANNKATPAAINAVSKAGDTMTGSLNIDGGTNYQNVRVKRTVNNIEGWATLGVGSRENAPEAIVILHKDGTEIGGLRVNGNGLIYLDSANAKNYPILHSGNYSNYAVPLDGSKAITGRLAIGSGKGDIHSYSSVSEFRVFKTAGDATIGRSLTLYDPTRDMISGIGVWDFDNSEGGPGSKFYTILHTGNRPSGSYTGNGSAAVRTIDTKGGGDVIFISSVNGTAIIGTANGLVYSSAGVTALPNSQSRFDDGVITLATTNEKLNANGITYYYQVL